MNFEYRGPSLFDAPTLSYMVSEQYTSLVQVCAKIIPGSFSIDREWTYHHEVTMRNKQTLVHAVDTLEAALYDYEKQFGVHPLDEEWPEIEAIALNAAAQLDAGQVMRGDKDRMMACLDPRVVNEVFSKDYTPWLNVSPTARALHGFMQAQNDERPV